MASVWSRLRHVGWPSVFAASHAVGAYLLAIASMIYGLSRVWPFTIDDAGIVYAYAKHLAAGLGPRAVLGGPAVEGYSDFLWVFLLTIVAKVHLALPPAAKVIGAALLVTTCFATMRLVRFATRTLHPAARWVEAVPPLFLGLCPDFVVWGPSGLENGLYWALLLVGFWLDARESERPELRPYSALALVGVALTRPEGVVFAGILFLAKATDLVRKRATLRTLALYVAFFAGPLLLYHAVHYAVFRELVPNTYYAKAPGQGAATKGLTYVHEGLRDTYFYALGPLATLGLFMGARRSLPLLFAALWALEFAVYSRGDWMPHHRFVGSAMPPLATLAAMGLLAPAASIGRLVRRPWATGVLAFVATLATWNIWFRHQTGRFGNPYLTWCHFCSRVDDVEDHRKVLASAGVRSATYLTHDFGGPAYSSTRYFQPIDLLGLCDLSFARLVYRTRSEGFPRFDFMRLQYAFHELGAPPTLLYFRHNFWPMLPATPEFQWGYIDVKLPYRKGRRDLSPSRLYRGTIVDFYPPVERFAFTTLDERFVLLGASAYERTKPAGEIDVSVALLERRASAQHVTFAVRVAGVPGAAASPFVKLHDLGTAIRKDEPVLFRLRARLPEEASPEAPIELGIRKDAGDFRWVLLFPASHVKPWKERPAALPFPNNLPGTEDPALLALEPELRRLITARVDRADLTLSDAKLGQKLAEAGEAADSAKSLSDAYLAYVWAMQADPSLTRDLHERVADLRPEKERVPYLMEHALLTQYYAAGEPLFHAALIEHLVRAELWQKAQYFLDRWPAAGTANGWKDGIAELRRAVQARSKKGLPPSFAFSPVPIDGISTDFEDGTKGWKLDGVAVHRAPDDDRGHPFWGASGHWFLSTEGPPPRYGAPTGQAESAEFTITGRALSFLVAGGSRTTSVELVVEGKVVEHAGGPHSRCFFPVFWDLRPYRGKSATFRVSDKATDADGYLAVDHVQVWPELP